VTYKNNYALNIVKIILEPLREDEQWLFFDSFKYSSSNFSHVVQ
jgi:hypothetical protein